MSKNLWLLISVCLTLAACGKSDDNAGAPKGQVITQNAVVPTQSQYPGTYFPPVENFQGHQVIRYSFFENGCSTGKQRVQGWDYASTKAALCERLQDDWAHRGCARGMRQAYFASACAGQPWSPR